MSTNALYPLGHQLGMFDEVGRGVDDAGHQHLVVGDIRLPVAEHGPFMAVAGVGRLEQHVARLGRHQRVEHLGHGDVADMGPLVVAPADVDAHPVLRHVLKRVVQRLDMGGRDLHELLVGQVREQHVAAEREVGAIELQVEASGHDGLVFLLHRIGERGEIGLPRRVVIILQEQADNAGACGVHEAPFDPVRLHRGLQIRDILPQFALALRFHLSDAHGAGVFRRSAVFRQSFQEAGEQLQVSGCVSRTVAVKAGIPILHVGRVGDFRCFAIGNNIDSSRILFRNGFRDRFGHRSVKISFGIGFLPFPGKDEIHDLLRARQASDMRGQDGHVCSFR
jgi:hypothetical protein